MDKATVKQLVEQLGNITFNLSNWTKIAELVIDDDAVVGGLVKVSGKQIKSQMHDSMRQVSNLVYALSKEVGNI
jgi:hypothetical protein